MIIGRCCAQTPRATCPIGVQRRDGSERCAWQPKDPPVAHSTAGTRWAFDHYGQLMYGSIESMTRAIPPVADDSGYCLTKRDLDFLGITEDSAIDCVAKTAPLGMTLDQYTDFIATLLEAIRREGFTNFDVRLQGSSVKFFSGPHKSMPYTSEEIFETYMREHGERPDQYDLRVIRDKLQEAWPNGSRPTRRPFDALYVTGLSSEPSDYDVQLSTDEAFNVIRDMLVGMGLRPDAIAVENATYQFMRKEFSDGEFLHLQRWAAKWWNVLKRPVNIAIFGGEGPKRLAPPQEALSSHFRDTDWIVQPLPLSDQKGDERKSKVAS